MEWRWNNDQLWEAEGDFGYTLTADDEGGWGIAHTTWSYQDGPDVHEDADGIEEDLAAAITAAVEWYTKQCAYLDEYERQMAECEEHAYEDYQAQQAADAAYLESL